MTFNETGRGTLRQEMYKLLVEDVQDARSLSQQLKIAEKEVMMHLPHVDRSARNHGQRLKIIPSNCLSCGYTFKDRKRPTKPGRCPRCKESYLSLPAYRIK